MSVSAANSSPNETYLKLEDDPLTNQSKEQIIKFVRDYLKGLSCLHLDALVYSYDRNNENSFISEARRIVDETHRGSTKSFNIFIEIFLNPAKNAKEFHLDANNFGQIFAAQHFMRAVVARAHEKDSLEKLNNVYVDAMAQNMPGDYTKRTTISLRNRMFMQNDPVQKLDPNLPTHTLLDILLSKILFLRPSTCVGRSKNDGPMVYKEEGPSREEARKFLKKIIFDLCEDPLTQHVMQAIAIVLERTDGRIYVNNDQHGVGSLAIGTSYGNHSVFMSPLGFYDNGNSIVLPSLMGPFEATPSSYSLRHWKGTLIHESLHFIFNHLVGNKTSPVKSDSADEKLLDETLKADRVHRSTLSFENCTEGERSVWETFVHNLERDTSYFPRTVFSDLSNFVPGYAENNWEHQHKMRVESIVRIMEQLASGITLRDIQAVAPNLCKFYFEVSQPLILKFIAENARSVTGVATPPPTPLTLPSQAEVESVAKAQLPTEVSSQENFRINENRDSNSSVTNAETPNSSNQQRPSLISRIGNAIKRIFSAIGTFFARLFARCFGKSVQNRAA